MPNPNCPDCKGSGIVVAGDLLGRPRRRPCALCKAYDEEVERPLNPYLAPLLAQVPTEWTRASAFDAPWEHLNELALTGHIEERVEEIHDADGYVRGSRFYYRRKEGL